MTKKMLGSSVDVPDVARKMTRILHEFLVEPRIRCEEESNGAKTKKQTKAHHALMKHDAARKPKIATRNELPLRNLNPYIFQSL
jgi:hypothetical protein